MCLRTFTTKLPIDVFYKNLRVGCEQIRPSVFSLNRPLLSLGGNLNVTRFKARYSPVLSPGLSKSSSVLIAKVCISSLENEQEGQKLTQMNREEMSKEESLLM